MALTAGQVREVLYKRSEMETVFLVPLAENDDVGTLLVKWLDGGDAPMVIAKESNGDERSLSWEAVCRDYEIVIG